jgi:N-acetylneuraminate synthase
MIRIDGRPVGDGYPTYIIAEIGINHNGDINIAKKLIDAAVLAGCDGVKFQKRTPELCVPPEQANVMRETPWGLITYMEYRRRVEFGLEEFKKIDHYCKEKNITWFASCWDKGAIDFIEKFTPPCYKIASASLTDDDLLKQHRKYGRPLILSTGMADMPLIEHAVDVLGENDLIVLHCTSTYPCKVEELNLQGIKTLKDKFPNIPIGYSGHEVGLSTTLAAVCFGACVIERHITLDRAMWGSDQAASIEPQGFMRLVRDIRTVEAAMGDGRIKIYDSEEPIIKRLRRVKW